ncbi:MAG: class I SAM-dependent methyltransferase family protein [Thermodesulfobacteriota bacterium]
MLCRIAPTFEQLKNPLPLYSPKNLYYKLLSLFLESVGRMSDGINIGFNHGFDSGMVMNYIYNNKAQGRYYIGRVLDQIFLNQVTCRAFRSIKQIQIDIINSYLLDREGQSTFIVDLASGKADYIYETLKFSNQETRVLLCDIAESALNESKEIAANLNLGSNVRFKQGDALDTENLKHINPSPDLLIEVGLYGIIHDDDLIRKHLLDVKEILNPGAILFNVQTQNPQIELIARSLKNQRGERCVWHLRSAEEVVKWAEEAGFKNPEITMDPYDIYAVVMMRG